MKKIYGFILSFFLVITGFIQSMEPTRSPHSVEFIKKWWEIPTWSKKKIAYSIGAIIITALALFGSYKGMVRAARNNIVSQLDNGTLPVSKPENKSIIDAYNAASSAKDKQAVVNTIMAPLSLGDLAVNAIGYLTGNPRFPF